QFSGKEKEQDGTGLYDFGARLYNPATGRWLSPDSVRQGNNPYTYALNNPVKNVDPDGHCVQGQPCPWWQKWADAFMQTYAVHAAAEAAENEAALQSFHARMAWADATDSVTARVSGAVHKAVVVSNADPVVMMIGGAAILATHGIPRTLGDVELQA